MLDEISVKAVDTLCCITRALDLQPYVDITPQSTYYLLVLPRFPRSFYVFTRTGLFPVGKQSCRELPLGVALQQHFVDVLGGAGTVQSAEVVPL